jgi:hypothetical protein
MEASLEQLSAPLPPWAIRAGARETIYHDPRNTTAAIVTCGGLCPGLNDVVAVSPTAQQGVGRQGVGQKGRMVDALTRPQVPLTANPDPVVRNFPRASRVSLRSPSLQLQSKLITCLLLPACFLGCLHVCLPACLHA